MLFKDISYLKLWMPFYSVEQNHLCNFSKGHHEEIIFKFLPVVHEVSFKDISYLELWWPFVCWSRTICAIW